MKWTNKVSINSKNDNITCEGCGHSVPMGEFLDVLQCNNTKKCSKYEKEEN